MSFTQYYEFTYLASCLEGFLFGIYSGIFAMHLKYDAIKREADNTKPNILFYALCLLYLLTVAIFATGFAFALAVDVTVQYRVYVTGATLFGCCDFIAQAILIHRCWIVWGRNIRVVIIPSILAFAYLVIWLTSIGAAFIYQGGTDITVWGNILVLTSLTASMTVNALVTGLIVFRIFKVFRVVKSDTTSEDKSFSINRGNKLRSVSFVIIESGMALFVIQLARVVITATTVLTLAELAVSQFVIGIHEILNGIAPTIIFVRVSLGLSFHDEESLAEAVSCLRFATDDPNPTLGTGSMDHDGSLNIGQDDPNPLPEMVNINQEERDSESGGSDDIQRVDR